MDEDEDDDGMMGNLQGNYNFYIFYVPHYRNYIRWKSSINFIISIPLESENWVVRGSGSRILGFWLIVQFLENESGKVIKALRHFFMNK